jgi:hypothetical protein
MDGNRFDEMTRAFGSGRPRRSVLKGLAGAALGVAGLARFGGAEAAKGGNSAAAHFCNAVFPPGPQRGQCVSDAAHGAGPFIACGGDPANYCSGTGTCADFNSEINNCGGCGNVCSTSDLNATAACVNGTCVVTCDTGFTDCNGVCVHTASDANNCGACGNVCPESNPTCYQGTCRCVGYGGVPDSNGDQTCFIDGGPAGDAVMTCDANEVCLSCIGGACSGPGGQPTACCGGYAWCCNPADGNCPTSVGRPDGYCDDCCSQYGSTSAQN